MFEYFPTLDKTLTKILNPVLIFFHKKLKLTPNTLSVIAAFFGFWSIFFVLSDKGLLAFCLIIISQIFDLLDGQVAKKYNLVTKRGQILDLTIDRTIEFSLIFSFVFLGKVGLKLAVLTAFSLLILTILKEKTKFDVGLKKIGIFAGYLIGFNLSFLFVFFFNTIGIIGALFMLFSKKTNAKHP